MVAMQSSGHRPRTSQRPFLGLGLLWLLLAAIIAITQFSQPAPITIEWRTETEVNTAGFNIYRASAENGAYIRINEQIIPGKGGPTSGSAYQYVDRDIESGETYFYRLEDVELDNTVSQHPPFESSAPIIPWWVSILVAASALTGVLLLARGLRTEKAT